jgi:APA family basic amino acid/polyamine antiporter
VHKLSLVDAIAIGLASMLGAGVFVVFGPATVLAGDLLPLAILLAALVSALNARSVAQLSKVVTRNGGAYSYAKQFLGQKWAFSAGISFLIGKTSSIAAISLVVVHYLGLNLWAAPIAIGIMTCMNLLGINRTALGSKILAGVTITALLALLIAASQLPKADSALPEGDALGVLGSAGLIFFAFAGYARVATLGAELRNPQQNVSRAIWISMSAVVLLYLGLGAILTNSLGLQLVNDLTPILSLTQMVIPDFAWLVAATASIASLGSLLALLAGTGRTAAVMSEDGLIPALFQRVNRFGAPWVAEVGTGLLASILVLSNSVVFAIGVSSFLVLTYYAIANLSAIVQAGTSRPLEAGLAGAGFLACLVIVAFVPIESMILGVCALVLALVVRFGLAKPKSLA